MSVRFDARSSVRRLFKRNGLSEHGYGMLDIGCWGYGMGRWGAAGSWSAWLRGGSDRWRPFVQFCALHMIGTSGDENKYTYRMHDSEYAPSGRTSATNLVVSLPPNNWNSQIPTPNVTRTQPNRNRKPSTCSGVSTGGSSSFDIRIDIGIGVVARPSASCIVLALSLMLSGNGTA